MTVEIARVAGEPAPRSLSYPVTVGWTEVALAVRSVLQLKTPVHLRMHIEMHGPLLIDFRHHAFSWATPLEMFPVDAIHTGLETIPTSDDAPPVFELPGQNLDGLLWEMGMNSFGGARAFWLEEGDRYHLTRWPNITHHKHDLNQVRMIAALGNAYATPAELAAFAGVELSDAQRLINALSLMRILTRSSAEPAVQVVPQTAAAKRSSLFSRLRKRLGR